MITCDECGRENDEEYKFCLGCGAALEASDDGGEPESAGAEMVNCPYCGAEQPSNFKFCGSCGEQIPQAEAADEEEGPPDGTSTAPGKPGGEKGEEESQEAPDPQPEPVKAERGQGQPPPMPSDFPDASDNEAGATVSKPEQLASTDTVPDAPARLIVIRPDGTEGASIDVPREKLTIGRASSIEALNNDPFLSPKHASLLYQEGDFVIQDESSLNGVFREVTDEIELQDRDLIRIGQELIKFEVYQDDPHAEDGETMAGGSPDPGYWGRLSLIAGPAVHTEAFALEEEEVTIGRETGDIVFKDDGFVSGTHAQVAMSEGKPVLRDLNSSNGTFIRIRGDHRIEDGERVLMGQQLFRLEVK